MAFRFPPKMAKAGRYDPVFSPISTLIAVVFPISPPSRKRRGVCDG